MQMPDLTDPVFIAKIVDFVIFVAAIVFLYQRFGRQSLEQMQEAQNKEVEDAIAHRAECERAVADAKAALAQSHGHAERMLTVGAAQAERMVADLRADAEQHAQRIRAHAGGELERERYRVRRELLEETVERAHAEARRIAQSSIDPAMQAGLVEDLIGGLERGRA